MTEEKRKAHCAALEEELAGHERAGNKERAAECVKQLVFYGGRQPAPKPKPKRAKA